MSETNRGKMTFLELVFPPISNQEAVRFKNEPVAEQMKQSDFYMIAGKACSTFSNKQFDPKTQTLSFDILIGDDVKSSGAIKMLALEPIKKYLGECRVSGGIDFIEFCYLKDDGWYTLASFTPENILWYRSRNTEGILGFDNYKELLTYDLLYVGIAKVGDSYERLIAKGHHARQEILSNEPQRLPGARVSDEIFLFLFRLEPLFITTYGVNSKIDLEVEYDHKAIVADAEKAYVSLLEPNYNTVRFKQYPKGNDGLYDSNLDRYCYIIAEMLTFNTPNGTIKGARDPMGFPGNEADFIFVDKKSAKLFISGVDFADE